MRKRSSHPYVLALLIGLSMVPTVRADPSPRLVSFSPALTRMAFDLGLGDQVVGVTTHCRLPEGETRPVVGSALSIRTEPILAVEPDILLIQVDRKHFEPIHRARPELRIEHFSIETLEELGQAMERLGRLAGRPQAGQQERHRFETALSEVAEWARRRPRKRVLFVMGYENPSGTGSGTFVHELIELAGGTNVLATDYQGWIRLGLSTALGQKPEVVLCQCRPDQRAEALAYWQGALGLAKGNPQVFPLTDPGWTIPAGHLAGLAHELARMLHPEPPPEPRP